MRWRLYSRYSLGYDYDYIKMSRQKELDADQIAIQQTEFVGQLKTPDNAIVDNKSMFVWTILEKT